MKTIRCAIYTRKSSEEGLEQDFNSLDAQREACRAYILSQASEGWSDTGELYDDGGISGGTLERPALKRLLADVAAGRIDIIVVYKVDRLTRSLLDFSKLVEAFDAAGTSFVSVTQSFNTTTSMGRLTLNMLLSFAQFEREVTAERIRDKIAASKAKGMWMGGTPPLGYRPNGRSLLVDEEHAAIVRHIFDRYLTLGSVRALQDELHAQGRRVPSRLTTGGKPLGGGAFTRGQLYHVLKNVTYTGRISHKGAIHAGQHPAIIDTAIFDRAQALLASHVQGGRRTRSEETSLFAGKIVDADGAPLLAAHSCKGRVRYRYYVSKALHHATSSQGLRVPAREIEGLVAQEVSGLFADVLTLSAAAKLRVPVAQLPALETRFRELVENLGSTRSAELPSLVERVHVRDGEVEIVISAREIARLAGCDLDADAPTTFSMIKPARITRSGHVVRLVHDTGYAVSQPPDRALVRLIVQARRWWTILRAEQIDMTALAEREGVSRSYLCRVIRLAFLSPAVIDAMLWGRQRHGVDVASLMPESAVAPSWKEQAANLLALG